MLRMHGRVEQLTFFFLSAGDRQRLLGGGEVRRGEESGGVRRNEVEDGGLRQAVFTDM